MKLGFTGTRKGMTYAQLVVAAELFGHLQPHELHHGDCVGADAQFAPLAALRQSYPCKSVVHPGLVPTKLRAFLPADETRAPQLPLIRNRHIVDETDELLAAPSGMTEQKKGGTWFTIRYARKQGKPITIVFPDGTMKQENV